MVEIAAMKDQTFVNLTAYIHQKFGINLGREKRALLEGRLYKLIAKLGLSDAEEYYEYLIGEKTGVADIDLVNAVTTNHTFFMRESEHFRCFSESVLPYWYDTIRDRDLRTWCAACSTGEEAYTLAMLIGDFFSLKNQFWDTTVLATDISHTALKMAITGIYTNESMASLPDRWRRIYFQKLDSEHYQANTKLKAEVTYRQFNLIAAHFPFKRRFHTIFCRNVMIYFDRQTRLALVKRFYECLEPGGYLFIGHSEVLDRNMTLFKYVMPSVYRKE